MYIPEKGDKIKSVKRKKVDLPKPVWELAPAAPVSFFEQFPAYSRPVAQLLYNRGLTDEGAVSAFLHPVYTRDLHNPRLLMGMDQAVGVILAALKADQHIVIHGDYDADGLTATALLHDVLGRLGGNVTAFIPDRYAEGYGVTVDTLRRLRRKGADLVITVDCGISSAEAIAKAARAGLKVVVTDHHLPPPVLPKAAAVVNPKQPGDQYPDSNLSGVGVAWKLAQALLRESELPANEQEATAKWLLDLVAIGTVADLALLTGENRVIVRYGLLVLAKTRRPGLRQLLRVAGLSNKPLEAESIGYGLAPRLNAAGRLTHAKQALELLTTTDEPRAEQLASQLDALNRERQRATLDAYQRAKMGLGTVSENDRILIVDGDFRSGLVGLVAGRLVQEYGRPALVIERGATVSKGSARSTPALDIVDALSVHTEYLSSYGGHTSAAGFSLPTGRLTAFREALTAFGRRQLAPADLRPALAIEATLAADQLSLEFLKQLTDFAPFGPGNPKPLFQLPGVTVSRQQRLGSAAQHLKLELMLTDGRAITALAFGQAERLSNLRLSQQLDTVGTPVVNTFNHRTALEWHITDCRHAPSAA